MEKQSIKYTTDGKKVVVIGDLNQTEKIVQEIYVTDDGCEIPQGERFVVKSLLDSPAKPWQEKELEELKLRYEKERKEWESRIEQMTKERSLAYAALSARVKWLRDVAKEPQMKSLNKVITTIADFMDGSTKWILVNDYQEYILDKFDNDGTSRIMDIVEGGRFDSMRLLSLYGDSNGNFDFEVDAYSNGGKRDRKVLFFRTKEEALKYMQDEIDNKEKYNDYDIKNINTFSLHVDKDKFNKYQNDLIEHSAKRIKEKATILELEKENYTKLKKGLLK